ncbi:ribonuclease R [Lacibacter luteus]|uniref:Ribonuclease R n=1 Tax=Lacibacter luteus TaxID=2508719 RepID=A0A4Q1CEA9_9BACT|nr:ribonuclease R [Lacibacter luteus]RXK58056.1 ribonuclease R [Lacibacter luteus]
MSKKNKSKDSSSKKKKQHKAPAGKTRQKSSAAGVRGVIEITRSGMGYVTVPDMERDVIVRPQHFNTALHGDTVEVQITKSGGGGGRMEGEITRVVERKQTQFIGRISIQKNYNFFIPETDRPMPDLFIPAEKLNGATNNDKVVAKLTAWDKAKRVPEGEVLELVKQEAENDIAMKQILLSAGFNLSFDDEVMEQAERFPDGVSADEVKKRRDFRDVLTFTIDPVDAKDFDDALSIKKGTNGLYEIGVHIADVSHYVIPGTALDDEAYARATSVYLPDRVSPMLPERISNELCSLRPREDKYTFSAVFKITGKGEIKDVWLGRTVIHSDHRFTYEQVQEIIEAGEGLYGEEILLLNTLAQKMRKDRFKKGAINFSSQEVRFVLDENRKPIGITIKESKEAHQLIEEFMLLANKHVAEYIGKIVVKDKPVPFPYRVHDTPDEAKLGPFMVFAKKYGHTFDVSSPQRIAESFNQMLKDAQGKPEQHVLEALGIRTMAKAVYTAENIGHYGLGFEHYCHFTSPIRRYPDVLVHRVLQQCLDNEPQIDKKMEAKCKHCSERERSAMESERAANKYKQVEYMSQFLGEEFEGVVSGVASFGFWVETVEHKCEGLVSLFSLNDFDDFRHIEEDYCLVGKRSGRTFRMGDKVTIKVVAANLEKRQLDYELVLGHLASTENKVLQPTKFQHPKKKRGKK